jgi:hypothetical protein
MRIVSPYSPSRDTTWTTGVRQRSTSPSPYPGAIKAASLCRLRPSPHFLNFKHLVELSQPCLLKAVITASNPAPSSGLEGCMLLGMVLTISSPLLPRSHPLLGAKLSVLIHLFCMKWLMCFRYQWEILAVEGKENVYTIILHTGGSTYGGSWSLRDKSAVPYGPVVTAEGFSEWRILRVDNGLPSSSPAISYVICLGVSGTCLIMIR